MHLIPNVKELNLGNGFFHLNEDCTILLEQNSDRSAMLATKQIAEELDLHCAIQARIIRHLDDQSASIRLITNPKLSCSYTLQVNDNGVQIHGIDSAGLFHGCQTLRQIIRQEGRKLKHLTIKDYPDYEARGFYHDVTRGKVPTLETLSELVEKASFYKLNQLQLYVEHTFDFRKHTGIAAGKSPLTACEILQLDELCQQHHIDLVPSMTTFGHCYEILRTKRLEHLGELGCQGSEYPYSWFDRQVHFTLDGTNPESIELIENMLDEYLPLFSSKHFNVCCDETLDLTYGKNARAGNDAIELYISFTRKIINAVHKRGRKVQLWGDILQKNSRTINQLSKDVTVLNWSYSPDLRDGNCELFEYSEIPFYVCPGTSGWNQFFNRIDWASQNIINFARQGKEHGACGLLNTDWGDHGHSNLLGCSLHGLALGAQCAWEAERTNIENFDKAFSLLELGDHSQLASYLMRQFSKLIRLATSDISVLFDPFNNLPTHEDWGRGKALAAHRLDKEGSKPDDHYAQSAAAMRQLRERFIDCISKANQLKQERIQDIITGMWGEILMHEAAHLIQCVNGVRNDLEGLGYTHTADEIRSFEQHFSRRWHAHNKPSEYFRLQKFLCQLADLMDTHGLRNDNSNVAKELRESCRLSQ
ncbi:glycoside hydrolase family 20 zincin-like fold domain-containing protein [Rubellicoccus peritrichatus]|uniref:Glycoside hydrolase family 20 zincin-like fold domain-containing protein n=1 Tax=Rubellicoccus peritrichatus TaxID=3080537 RepID=A0AAQ3L7N2_9BACT|nr:glycoside hydrolase family 20 zincin-like fold domain-containing protein [Puniceicoccus sp. CR14]WOO39369.1 glycoside hydrolase family 20 zincin-like fold domain-containing protein [Puniceicoccus sp. CR14]